MVPSTYLGRESEAGAEAPARRQCLGPAGPPRLTPRTMATPKHSPNPLSICQSANEKQAVEKPQDFVSIRPDKGLKKVHDSQLPRTTLGDRELAGVMGLSNQGRKRAIWGFLCLLRVSSPHYPASSHCATHAL